MMTTTLLPPSSVRPAEALPRNPRRRRPARRPREPGLTALALGLLALASSVHPFWALPAVAIAAAAAALSVRALRWAGERRSAVVGFACAGLALLVCSVTAPAAARAGLAVLTWIADARPGR
ncbi:hypothetical protein [Rathayibacter rathayi]|uniref:DUF4190 domain-containing protein n=1 Tax=Rathayibacter rathayi TaxID=33887 RepID=A0ABX5A8D4_RATRA|nr:hypothetical protein [Rathayibacter rathayi]MWV75102.1 hypothetical protein [Rathayibacter rathayi NCPPB 2980 = VKM Ac-1601]PPG94690.1 hypothetical protein C5C22_07785 [Rathayibacter rathayi]PPH73199.1 hypothetical protein C5C40_13995 [Rathayibacter rathayi]PPI65333.1 hypothetical protein C5E02_00305 [Rathayibacter rathayi]